MADPDRFDDSKKEDTHASFAIVPIDTNNPNKGWRLRIKDVDSRGYAYLISNKKNPIFWTKLIFTTAYKERDLKEDRSVWHFERVGKD